MSRTAVLKVLASGQVHPSPCWPRARCPLCGRSGSAVRHTRRGLHWAWSVRRPWTGQSGGYVHTQRLAGISSSLSVLWVPLSWWYLCLDPVIPTSGADGQRDVTGLSVCGSALTKLASVPVTTNIMNLYHCQIQWMCTIVKYNDFVSLSDTMNVYDRQMGTLYHCQIQWLCTIVKYNDFVSLSSRMNLYNTMNLYYCQVQ